MGDPARGYSWAPFQQGNQAAMTHGAASPNVVRPLADAIAAELLEQAPWLRSQLYTGTVGALAWVEAQCVLIREWLDAHGLLDGEGMPRPAATWLVKLEARAENLRARCGLDPLSMAKLLGAVQALGSGAAADELEALKAEHRAVVAGWRELAAPAPEPPDEAEPDAGGITDDREVTA